MKRIINQPIDYSRLKKIETPYGNLVSVNGELIYLYAFKVQNPSELIYIGNVANTGEPVHYYALINIDEYGEGDCHEADFFSPYQRILTRAYRLPDNNRSLSIDDRTVCDHIEDYPSLWSKLVAKVEGIWKPIIRLRF